MSNGKSLSFWNFLWKHIIHLQINKKNIYINVLIEIVSGGTGFLGKILIEKLLRTCSGLSTIYLLIRPKKNKSVQCRLEELFKDPVSKYYSSILPWPRESGQ